MKATGVEKQEQKIIGLAEVVRALDPKLELLPVKGALRMSIDAALKDIGLDSWKQVADKPIVVKRSFFSSLCEYAVPRLVKIGFPAEKGGELATRLRAANEKYIH